MSESKLKIHACNLDKRQKPFCRYEIWPNVRVKEAHICKGKSKQRCFQCERNLVRFHLPILMEFYVVVVT